MKAQREKQAARQAAKPAAGDMRSAFDSTLTELKTLLSVEPQAAPAEGDSLLADADCHGGSMPHTHAEGGSTLDDEECVGGSMAHSHAEGQSRAEQHKRRQKPRNGKADRLTRAQRSKGAQKEHHGKHDENDDIPLSHDRPICVSDIIPQQNTSIILSQ